MVDLKIKLPESFFLAEERDGYWVSAEMKELWAVQLDMLCEFDRVCKKYNLNYILEFGTLLGAVRHKGFIPWDDDLDVSMLREDYDKLMEVAPKEFKHPYFLQNFHNEKNYDACVAKLRRSDTTFFIKQNIRYHVKFNQGIFMDIFVFDRVPDNSLETLRAINEESWLAWYRMITSRHGIYAERTMLRSIIKQIYYRIRYGSNSDMLNRWESIARKFYNIKSDYVGTILYIKMHCRPRVWLEKTIEAPFEGFMFSIPEAYDQLLTQCYGDYMTPKQEGSIHTRVFFDANRSYKDVLADKSVMKSIAKEMMGDS